MIQSNLPTIIAPIDTQQQQIVIDNTYAYIDQAAVLFDLRLPHIPVLFDLRGRAAGMYRLRDGKREIRYNPWIFSRYFEANVQHTIPHEVSHYVVEKIFGRDNIKPHGNQWRKVMLAFGREPRVTCDYDLSDIRLNKVKRFGYHCGCRSHQLTTCRHNKILRGEQQYLCKHCGQILKLA